jgi:hypothetical protein
MTGDSSTRLLDEAQRLLDERGAWTTEAGAYLESEQVTVVVHPVFDDGQGQSLDAGEVDLVVTVRPRQHCDLPPGAGVSLVGGRGGSVFKELNLRGQAVFRHLPAGEWRAQLIVGEPAGSASPRRRTDITPLHTISRLLAAAAGDRPRTIRESYISVDGRVTTDVEETPEARLVIRISTEDAPGPIALVRLRWAVVVPQMIEEVKALVVPLAPSQDGGGLVAKYDLGSLEHVHAVKIGAAEWAEPSELTGDLVRHAFGFSLYGTARRAWENLASSNSCPPDVQAALRELLA